MNPVNADSDGGDTHPEFEAVGQCHAAFFAEGEPSPVVSVSAVTHLGLVRSKNEDHFLVARRSRRSEVVLTSLPPGNLAAEGDDAHLLLVATVSAGGFGEVASRLVVSKVWELSGRATIWLMKVRDESSREPYIRMRHYVQTLHQAFDDALLVRSERMYGGTSQVLEQHVVSPAMAEAIVRRR